MHGHGSSTAPAGPTLEVDPDVHHRRWAILGVLSLSLMITAIDHTIMNVALPRMVVDLGATTSQLQWIVDSYTVVFAGLLLAAGALGDRFGRKGALQLGLGLFLAGSLFAALSDSAGGVITARAVMGVGGAFIMPATLSILTNSFGDPAERAKAIGVWAGVAGIGVALGPIAGGYLLADFSWSSVFWLNVPVVVAALVLGRSILPTSKAADERPLDPVGSALSITALTALVYSVIEAPAHGWTSGWTVTAVGIALTLVTAFVGWEVHHHTPMLDVRFFANPRFSAASVSITFAFFALAGAIFLATQYLQFVLGYSPLRAGLGILPVAGALAAAGPISAHVTQHVGGPIERLALPADLAAAAEDNIGAATHAAATLDPATGAELVSVAREGFVDAMHMGMWIGVAFALVGAAVAAAFLPSRQRNAVVHPIDRDGCELVSAHVH